MSIGVQLAYLVAWVCFILALKGLSSPRNARTGNLVGAAGMIVAVAATFAVTKTSHLILILVALAIGLVVGIPAARSVPMTAMPQMVALFNGVGGGAAALVSIAEFIHPGEDTTGVTAAVLFSAVVGCISFTGSALTFAKLQEMMTSAPITYPGGRIINLGLVAVVIAGVVFVLITGSVPILGVVAVLALLFGLALVLPVGGADVPVVISLLNAFTGLAVAASGFALDNTLLIVAGTLVGSAGTLLTQLMSQAMGRSLTNILFGAFTAKPVGAAAGGAGGDRPVRSATAEDIAILLAYARRVVIVPGYGLAVAQAQHTIRELGEMLEKRGVEVVYGIHPVAGRMPGHMNVLLAEADVPYEQLQEMDDVNPEFSRTDVALVVGANDVVNPGAKTNPDSPIYGMPILEVADAKSVVFLKRSMRPGFAGVENELLYDPKTTMLFGDAKSSLSDVVSAVRSL